MGKKRRSVEVVLQVVLLIGDVGRVMGPQLLVDTATEVVLAAGAGKGVLHRGR